MLSRQRHRGQGRAGVGARGRRRPAIAFVELGKAGRLLKGDVDLDALLGR